MSEPHTFPCGGCGARVEYAPGTTVLRCPYCGHEQSLIPAARQVREHVYAEALAAKPRASLAQHVLTCRKCGASTQSDALSQSCSFCGAPLVADATAGDQIAPEAVLPFAIDRAGMREALRAWISTRRFAPSSLKKVREAESTSGTYLPYWTFDAETVSDYTGRRGEHYYTTETYTVTVNGQSQTRTRQVRKTRWYPASGTVSRSFDDVMVSATSRMSDKEMDELDPWPLARAQPYQPAYLAGFTAVRYDVEPEQGLVRAKERMAPEIQRDCREDIGGDVQEVHSVDTSYSDITFKLMLLPVWMACYLYAGRTYRVVVNGATGTVVGDRPYSKAKIAGAILVALLVIVAIILLIVYARGH